MSMKIHESTALPAAPAALPAKRSRPQTATQRVRLEAPPTIEQVGPLADSLRSRVIGQNGATETLIADLSRLVSGLRDPSRPFLTVLMLGPTGVGKTETAKAMAQGLFGSDDALTRINCEEYAHGFEISKLMGAPPGYVGHNVEPLLSQGRIDAAHRRLREESHEEEEPLRLAEILVRGEAEHHASVVLFDEVEKGHPDLWNSLLGVLEDGTMTLGDNSEVDFRHSIILMTSNVGSRDLVSFLDRSGVGFEAPANEEPDGEGLGRVARRAAEKRFPAEFLNRLDEVLIYEALSHDDLERIFEKFLADVHHRALTQARVPLLIRISPEARERLIAEGTDLRLGARPLRRAMERELVGPLSRMIAAREVAPGDVVEVELEADRLAFFRGQGDSTQIVV